VFAMGSATGVPLLPVFIFKGVMFTDNYTRAARKGVGCVLQPKSHFITGVSQGNGRACCTVADKLWFSAARIRACVHVSRQQHKACQQGSEW